MLKVVLIDDSATTRMLLSKTLPLLSPDELEITECENGLKGLQAIIKMGDNVPDLIITDLKMPDMSGEELLETLKAHPYYKKTPIVVLSGVNDQEIANRLKKLGALTVIPKPPPQQSLAKVLHFVKKRS